MSKKTFYSFDPTTGEFMGEVEGQVSKFVTSGPANTLTKTPPKTGENEVARRKGSDWEVVEDHRGLQGFIENQPLIINEIGSLPDGFTTQKVEEPIIVEQAEKFISSYAAKVRNNFAQMDTIQAEAYHQAEIVARRVIAGDASTADKAFLKARDVDAKTINPMTGKPVKSVDEAAQVIVMTAEIWYDVLNTTEVARKQAIAQVHTMSEIPSDLQTWLTENFKWLPDNLS